MNREKHSEKVLSVRVSNKVYEGLSEIAKEKETTISELTRQALILVYLRALVGAPDSSLKLGADITELFESEEGVGSAIEEIKKELQKNKEFYKGYIDTFSRLLGSVEENEKAVKKIEKKVMGELKNKFIKYGGENKNQYMVYKRASNVFLVSENETRLGGSSVSSSRGWSGAPHKEQEKENI